MRVKLRRIIQSAESARQQSPGRRPWERHEYETSPERAAQVFGKLCKSLCRPFRAKHQFHPETQGSRARRRVLFHPGLCCSALSALGIGSTNPTGVTILGGTH